MTRIRAAVSAGGCAVAASAAMVAALAGAADAQTVRAEGSPVRAGGGVQFVVEVPAEWQVDDVTVDPIDHGLDTFVRRLTPWYGTCPSGQRCFYDPYHIVDERTAVGEHAVPFTATGGGRIRTFTGRFRVEPFADDDRDGMADTWERREGLEPSDRLGTSAPGDDPDGDLVGNIDEFRAGTSPIGRYRQYFGDASPGDRQQMYPRLAGLAPIRVPNLYEHVRVRLVGDDGRQVFVFGPTDLDMGLALFDWAPNVSPAARVLAIEIESPKPVVVEERLQSIVTGTLSTNRSVAPSADWMFTTGPTSEPVDSFLLAYNPASTAVRATFTYFRSADEAPVVTERVLQPGRTTVWLNADESGLAGRDFAVAIHADGAVIVDRGLRWQPPGRTAPQEHVSPGAPLAAQWYFPYVNASRQSDEQLVLANPADRESGVEVAIFRREGEPRVRYTTIPAHTRITLRPADFDLDTLAAVRFATTNGVPFVAEHMQRGSVPGRGNWASITPGVTATGIRWGLPLHSGHLVVWNPSDTEAVVDVTAYYPGHYLGRIETTLRIPARRVARIPLNPDPNSVQPGETVIEGTTAVVFSRPRPDGTPGPAIVVGRATPAGALGTRNVRIEPFIATRVD